MSQEYDDKFVAKKSTNSQDKINTIYMDSLTGNGTSTKTKSFTVEAEPPPPQINVETSSERSKSHISNKTLKIRSKRKVGNKFCGKQLYALLWKSFITRRVHFLSTIFEIFSPIVIVFILCFFKNSLSSSNDIQVNRMKPETIFNFPIHQLDFDDIEFFSLKINDLYYAPINKLTKEMFSYINYSTLEINGFENEKVLKENLWEKKDENIFGVFVNGIDLNGRLEFKLFHQIDETIEQVLNKAYPLKIKPGPNNENYFHYYRSFCFILSNINRAYIMMLCKQYKHQCNQYLRPILLFQMPYPSYVSNQFELSNQIIFGIIISISYVIISQLIVKRICDEKLAKIKEFLTMIGMSERIYWFSHFINHFIILFIQAIGILVLLYHEMIIVYSDWILVFIGLLAFMMQVILFSMVITAILNRPLVAVVTTTIVWIVGFLFIFRSITPMNRVNNGIDANQTENFFIEASFFPFGSIILLFGIIGFFENNNMGMKMENIDQTTMLFEKLTYQLLLLWMFCSIIVYILIIWCLEKAQSFVVLDLFCSKKRGKYDFQTDKSFDSKEFEPEPVLSKKMVQVKNLNKTFKSLIETNKEAVKDLSFNVFENQLTVLLGHNGAGKTVTMSIITGLFPATSGSVHINGLDISTKLFQARQNISLCPQENVFYNELTVYEHLKLFALLKNQPFSEINTEVENLIDLLHLRNKMNVLATKLSGGMKRKLQLAMALISNTKILILDEPTTGMDPETRRIIWDLLLKLRRERTILLTTHSMEEADILGDRIIIIKDGKTSCWGSSMYLKAIYGAGYMLRVAKLEGFNSKKFLNIIRMYISSAVLIDETPLEAKYSLNFDRNSQTTSIFVKLFVDMEQNKKAYSIDSYGMSYTTLEDVFLAVEGNFKVGISEPTSNNTNDTKNVINLTDHLNLLTGVPLVLSQFKGLFIKRFYCALRYWPMFIFQMIIPISIFMCNFLINHENQTQGIQDQYFNKGQVLDLKAIYGKETKPFFYGDQRLYKASQAINTIKGANETFNLGATRTIDNINKWLLRKGIQHLPTYTRKYIYGFGYGPNPNKNISENSFTTNYDQVWFNNEQYHSYPLALITHFETLIRMILPENVQDKMSIKITNSPIYSVKRMINNLVSPALNLIFQWIFHCLLLIPIAFPFLASSYILFPIKEQQTKIKSLQFLSGLSPITFWISNFIFDLFHHFIITVIIYAMVYSFDNDHIYFNKEQQNITGIASFLLLFCFGFATIPLSYLLSHFFSTSTAGFVTMLIIYMLFGLFANLIFSMIDLLMNFNGFEIMPKKMYESYLHILRLFPIFSFLFGYQKIYKLSSISRYCKLFPPNELELICKMGEIPSIMTSCCKENCSDQCLNIKNIFANDERGCGLEIRFLLFSGVLCFILNIMFEASQPCLHKISASMERRKLISLKNEAIQKDNLSQENEDVLNEATQIKKKVMDNRMNDLLTVFQLTKIFHNFIAVNELSFGVKHNEVFGLLGVNGAGKTTTFSMLIGDLFPTEGNVFIKKGQQNVQTHIFQNNIGYCPQFDGLFDNLNSKETLYLFARLRGVPHYKLDKDVAKLIQMVDLEKNAKQLVKNLNIGNRRKLSIAIALVGNPPLLLLDEPTSGIDPMARRKIWETLNYTKRNFYSSIVLTSHSMDECEALCDRIAILVNGKFHCLGSMQRLKSKYGQGYLLMIRLQPGQEYFVEQIKLIQQNVKKRFPSAQLQDWHQSVIYIQITDKNETWPNLFSKMEELKILHNFEDYVISGTTLEQIFISFAREQLYPGKQIRS